MHTYPKIDLCVKTDATTQLLCIPVPSHRKLLSLIQPVTAAERFDWFSTWGEKLCRAVAIVLQKVLDSRIFPPKLFNTECALGFSDVFVL